MFVADTKTGRYSAGDRVANYAFHLLILMSDSFTYERVEKCRKLIFSQASEKCIDPL
jgi:hypothetical protein